MTLTSPLPLVVLMTLFLALGHGVCKLIPFYARECGPASCGRYEAIDGLRGYLALGVFFGHAVLSFQWYEKGTWGADLAGLYGAVAHVAVALFFMITGFLFWGKVRRMGRRMDWKALYVSRLRRLVPLYLFSVAMVLGVVAIKTDFELNVSLRRLAIQVSSWLSFSFIEPMDVNGMRGTEQINAGVLWTLAYEWKFYLGLPLLALFASGWKFVIVALAFVVLYLFVPSERIAVNFLLGMLVANVAECSNWSRPLRSPAAALVAFASCFALLLLNEWRVWLEPPLLFALFMIIAHGNGLFGLLTHPAAKYLGTVSYSIYLLHGIFLYGALQLLDRFIPISGLNPLEYWLVMTVVGTGVVLGCGLSYRFVEYPFLADRPAPIAADRSSPTTAPSSFTSTSPQPETTTPRPLNILPEKAP